MAKILNIETSTTVCSVAVGIDGKLISLKEINDGYSHAEQLEKLIIQSLKEASLTISDLDAVSVSKGPGSYTGLRIGVSLAKGICFGNNISLISIPTLESLACHPKLVEEEGLKVPMLDARRMEVYACVLNSQNEVVEETSAVVVDKDSFSQRLASEKVLFFGPGMEKCKEVLSSNPNSGFVDEILPSASLMIEKSQQKFDNSQFENVAYFEPFYLKDFVAGKPKKLL